MIKKIVLINIISWMAAIASAQISSQNLEIAAHPELVNPSYEGGQQGISALILYGEKWSGFKGAPKTTGFNARYGFNEFVGIGLKGDFEKAGHRNSNIVGLSTDVNIRLSHRSYLALGLNLGMEMWHYSLEDAITADQGMLIEDYDRNNFIGGFGLTYRWRDLAIGASSYVSFYKEESNMARAYLTASYDVRLMQNWYIRPLALYSYNNKYDDFWEAGAMAGYRHLAGVGVTYRQDQGVNIMANVEIVKMLTLGACYAISTGKVADFSKKSFEISLGFKMNKD